MPVEKVGPQGPGQALDMDPIPGPPHAGVVVQIPGRDEFAGEPIEHRDAALACHDRLGPSEQRRIGLSAEAIHLGAVVGPNAGPQLEPTLPVIAPHQLLHQFLHGLEAASLEQRAHQLFGGHQSSPQGRRQPRHMRMSGNDLVAQRPVARRLGQKCLPTSQSGRTRAGKCAFGIQHRGQGGLELQFLNASASAPTGRTCGDPSSSFRPTVKQRCRTLIR